MLLKKKQNFINKYNVKEKCLREKTLNLVYILKYFYTYKHFIHLHTDIPRVLNGHRLYIPS